jgi:BioD-like phosphotransacetylase family protein
LFASGGDKRAVSFLFIGSTGDRAGHSLLTWAIARRLLEKGLGVGYVKPFGTNPFYVEGSWTDHDAYLFRQVLKLKEPMERICPYLISDETWRQKGNDEIMEDFKSLAQELSECKDVLLIMGSKHIFFDDAACPIPDISLIPELKADLLLVHRYRKISRSIYSILSVSSLLRERIKGIIVNRVPSDEIHTVRKQLVLSLRGKGIPVTTALPEDPILSFRSLHEVSDILSGDLLFGAEKLGKPFGGISVGSGDLTGTLSVFKRAYNKIILLEPLAPDLRASASPRPVAAILLTGGRNPAPQLLKAAKEADVPLMLVKQDTFEAMEVLEQSTSQLSPLDEIKVDHITEMMDQDGALERLFKSLGIPDR